MGYLIYGKQIKPIWWNGKWIQPDSKFAALNYKGVRCSRLSDADDYATKEDAQDAIDKAKKYWKEHNKEDYFQFEIRKAK